MYDGLYDIVDKFILVEATRTFQNCPKLLDFNENKERFAKFSDKIIHVTLKDHDYPEFPRIGNQEIAVATSWEVFNRYVHNGTAFRYLG